MRPPKCATASVPGTRVTNVGAAAPRTVLAQNPDRIAATFVNDGAIVAYLRLGLNADAGANAGIRLNANGGSFSIGFANLYTGVVTARTAAGVTNILVTELEAE